MPYQNEIVAANSDPVIVEFVPIKSKVIRFVSKKLFITKMINKIYSCLYENMSKIIQFRIQISFKKPTQIKTKTTSLKSNSI